VNKLGLAQSRSPDLEANDVHGNPPYRSSLLLRVELSEDVERGVRRLAN
jgi:hypothetical protein